MLRDPVRQRLGGSKELAFGVSHIGRLDNPIIRDAQGDARYCLRSSPVAGSNGPALGRLCREKAFDVRDEERGHLLHRVVAGIGEGHDHQVIAQRG
jgi:hypothetical protein